MLAWWTSPHFGIWSAGCGSLVWCALVAVFHPVPLQPEWAVCLLLLSPLVLVPLGLRLAALPASSPWSWQAAVMLQLPTALLLLKAFTLPAGMEAAAFTLPWLATTGLIALFGLVRLWSRGWTKPAEASVSAGMIFLVVGGGWLTLSRLGVRPLHFEDIIVLLTAIHFHYAGFVLPLLTGLAGRSLPGRTASLAAVGVMAGVPFTAVGITATQLGFTPLWECLAAWLTALSGLLTAYLHLRLACRKDRPILVRALWTVAGLSLSFGMVLAVLYGSRAYVEVTALDIPWMRALHGTAGALGFGLAGLTAWSLETSGKK